MKSLFPGIVLAVFALSAISANAVVRSKSLQLRIAELEAGAKEDKETLSKEELSERSKLADYYVLTGRCSDALSLLLRTRELATHAAYCSCGSDLCKNKNQRKE